MQQEATTVTTLTILKNIAYIPAILLGLSLDSYLILVVFMTVDIVLGITRTIVIYGGQHFRSYRLSIGIISKLMLLLVPLLLAWTGKGVGLNLIIIAQWSLGALILAEAYSILGNIHAIRIRKDVPEFDAVSWIIRRIQVILLSILQKGIEDKGSFSPSFSEKPEEYEKKD